MIGNRTAIEKADLELSNLLGDGGILVPAQARTFIRTLIEESVMLPQATVVPMRSFQQRIEKIRFASRVLRPGREGVALAPADRVKPDLEKEELNVKLFKAEVRLNNEVLEDSIERGNLRGTTLSILGDAIARDMDEIIIQGDTTSADVVLAELDGILKQASQNVVDADLVPFSKTIMRDMLKAMPQEFLRNKAKMRFFVPMDTEIEYRDTTAQRESAAGDEHLQGEPVLRYQGVPIIRVPLFPDDLGIGQNEQNALLTDPKNVNVGIWRQVTLETDKDVSAGVLIVVASMRFDVKFAEKRATVKATRLVAAA